jgi:hypothetical protein
MKRLRGPLWVACAASLAACSGLVGIDDRYLVADAGEGGTEGAHPEADISDASGVDQAVDVGTVETAADGTDSATEQHDSATTPGTAGPSHLRLWLTADVGVHCESGRVTRWADQSQHGDDALLGHSQLGPQCQIPTNPHSVNGIDLPYFSAPVSAVNPNVVDETLDVDLSFLVGTSFTLFAVSRRWADPVSTNPGEYLLGTAVASAFETGSASCATAPHDSTLSFGYIDNGGSLNLTLDEGCDGLNALDTPVPQNPPGPMSRATAMFGASAGRTLWINGVQVSSDLKTTPLAAAMGGAVGRAIFQTTASGYDQRFRGDIAEIVVYDAALADAERKSVEDYLAKHWGLN